MLRSCSIVIAVLLIVGGSQHSVAQAKSPRQPNIVFILADDLGWSELGCYGNGFNETPNLDRLARGGMRFTHAYAAAPVCSPYRAALLTGQYPARIGILDYLRPNSANALSTDHVTLPEMLGKNGYATGMIGKWHLTGYDYHDAEQEIHPRDHGFAWNVGSEVKAVGNGANFWPYVFRTQPISWIDLKENRLGEQEYLTDRLNLEAVNFIERNAKRPFFLYLSHYAPHTILNGRPDLVAKYRTKHRPGRSTRDRCYLCQDHGHSGDALNHWAGDHNPHLAAMLESIDDGVGLIVAKLEELGLAENTIVIFSSDNGGETNVTSNAPLRGGKSQLYEGGVRVPLIVRWPKHVPSDTLCQHPTVNTDFYPTLLGAAGAAATGASQVVDGTNMLATWKNPNVAPEREAIYWHYPLDRPHFLGGASGGAVRQGKWKLIEFFDSGRTELFSLPDDPSEQTDLSEQEPAIVAKLSKKLATWRESVEARTPSPPLLTSPRQLYFADHFSSGAASSRWFFNKDWMASDGVLKRVAGGPGTTRLFLKGASYGDVTVRFDFRLGQSRDVRLVTGGGGYYNAVIHIRHDHFFIQTARDERGPYFSYRHGECAFPFESDRWYTMTVEFLGDQLVAHLDHAHVAFAQHPMLDTTREYFALQVDDHAAEFDNIQILTAAKHQQLNDNLDRIRAASGRHPVEKTVDAEFAIQKSNAHEWFFQRSPGYRALVERVDELDAENKRLYPDVFRSHKGFRKKIADERRRLLEGDPRYKELLFATYRADREITAFLVAKRPEVADYPQSRKPRAIERLRIQFEDDAEYRSLLKRRDDAQERLESAYPQLFITDKQITELRNQKRKALNDDPAFRQRVDERAAAWRAQEAFLFANDKRLAELREAMAKKSK